MSASRCCRCCSRRPTRVSSHDSHARGTVSIINLGVAAGLLVACRHLERPLVESLATLGSPPLLPRLFLRHAARRRSDRRRGRRRLALRRRLGRHRDAAVARRCCCRRRRLCRRRRCCRRRRRRRVAAAAVAAAAASAAVVAAALAVARAAVAAATVAPRPLAARTAGGDACAFCGSTPRALFCEGTYGLRCRGSSS